MRQFEHANHRYRVVAHAPYDPALAILQARCPVAQPRIAVPASFIQRSSKSCISAAVNWFPLSSTAQGTGVSTVITAVFVSASPVSRKQSAKG